jgi:hypothetical protein
MFPWDWNLAWIYCTGLVEELALYYRFWSQVLWLVWVGLI